MCSSVELRTFKFYNRFIIGLITNDVLIIKLKAVEVRMLSEGNRIYMAIDLKSFYASVECVERELDPLNTNLVVADSSKTEKTICLAVSPSLKQYGIGGRARLFEVIQKVKEINRKRKKDNRYREFRGKSHIDSELKNDTSLELGFIIAPPRMAFYIDYSKKIYEVYLKYVSAEDIHVYSIDEVFIDAIQANMIIRCLELSNPKEPLRKITPAGTG